MTEETESNYPNETREEFIERIQTEGFIVRYPKDNELFIDIDSEEDYQTFLSLYRSFQRTVLNEYPDEPTTYKITPSKSGLPKRHIVVTIPFLVDNVERIAYQAALGSDRVRELLSLERNYKEDEYPTLFIEKSGFREEVQCES